MYMCMYVCMYVCSFNMTLVLSHLHVVLMLMLKCAHYILLVFACVFLTPEYSIALLISLDSQPG